MQLNILVLSYIVAGAASVSVAFVAWRRRHMVGARELALLMLAVGWWLFANAFEASSVAQTSKIVWSAIAYPGIEAAPVVYLLFVLVWTRQDSWLTQEWIGLLLVIPVVSCGVAATNQWHHLLWTSVTLIDAWGVTAVYEHGPWFWIEAAYAYVLVGAGLVALVVAISRYPVAYAGRIGLVIVASLVPASASVIYALGLDAPLHADLSSIAFASAGFIGAWAVLRSRLLDIVPVAWSTVVGSLADAVLVLDSERRIVAFNQSATRLLGAGADSVGQVFDQALRGLPELVSVLMIAGDHEAEIPSTQAQCPPTDSGPEATASQSDRWINVRVIGIAEARGRDSGRLVIVRDVTERRQMVEAIRTLSHTDELTGLLNRRGFTALAEQQMRTSIRTHNRLWLLFADVDALKEINDRFGHDAGDRALCEIARLLRTGLFREADLVARLGGDEFAILATEISPAHDDRILQRVNDAVRRANEKPGREFELSLSIGTSIFDPEQPRTLDDLVREADRRMYQAKHPRRTAASSRAVSRSTAADPTHQG